MGDTKTQCRDNQLPENLNHHIHAFTDIWPWALACQVLAKVNCNSNSVISVMTKLMGVKSYSTRVNILKQWVLRAEGSRKVDERQPHAWDVEKSKCKDWKAPALGKAAPWVCRCYRSSDSACLAGSHDHGRASAVQAWIYLGFVAWAWMVSAFVWPDHACRGACTAIGSTYNLRSRGLFRHWKRENTLVWEARCRLMYFHDYLYLTHLQPAGCIGEMALLLLGLVSLQVFLHQAPNHHIPGLVHIQIQSLEISRDPWSDFVCIPYKLKWSQHKVSTKRRGPMALSLRCSANQTNLAIRAPHLFRWSG